MCVIIERNLACNFCFKILEGQRESNPSAANLRELARTKDWAFNGKDICPECREKKRNEKEKAFQTATA